MGISNPFITHAHISDFTYKRAFKDGLKHLLTAAYQIVHSLSADKYIFQTNHSKSSFAERYRINIDNCVTIPNAYDPSITERKNGESYAKLQNLCYILCPGECYYHKGYHELIGIAQMMIESGFEDFKFVLTLSNSLLLDDINQKISERNLTNYFINIGRYEYDNVANVYAIADLVFIPSRLETFSISYIEAIQFDIDLVVNDCDFSRDACSDIAIFVDSTDHENSADTLVSLIRNKRRTYGAEKRLTFLKRFVDQKERCQNIIKFILDSVDA